MILSLRNITKGQRGEAAGFCCTPIDKALKPGTESRTYGQIVRLNRGEFATDCDVFRVSYALPNNSFICMAVQ